MSVFVWPGGPPSSGSTYSTMWSRSISTPPAAPGERADEVALVDLVAQPGGGFVGVDGDPVAEVDHPADVDRCTRGGVAEPLVDCGEVAGSVDARGVDPHNRPDSRLSHVGVDVDVDDRVVGVSGACVLGTARPAELLGRGEVGRVD